jgi:hypothetical protein
VTATTNLASIGILHDIRWNAALQAYEVSVGPYSNAQIKAKTADAGPYGQSGTIVAADGSEPYGLLAWTGLSFTRFGYYYNRANSSAGGSYAFGLLTPAGAVPTTGTATYTAQLDGSAYKSSGEEWWGVTGTASFLFDFGRGTLSGHMNPELTSAWDPPPKVPVYNFTTTVFAVGSTTFSGGFDVTGPTPGSFQGQFTGPNAQELMAGFAAPYFDTTLNSWGVLQGVMAGKR